MPYSLSLPRFEIHEFYLYRLNANACPDMRMCTYHRSYMRHLLRGKVLLGARLAIIHNTHYIQSLMRDLREAIAAKRVREFADQWYAQRPAIVPGERD